MDHPFLGVESVDHIHPASPSLRVPNRMVVSSQVIPPSLPVNSGLPMASASMMQTHGSKQMHPFDMPAQMQLAQMGSQGQVGHMGQMAQMGAHPLLQTDLRYPVGFQGENIALPQVPVPQAAMSGRMAPMGAAGSVGPVSSGGSVGPMGAMGLPAGTHAGSLGHSGGGSVVSGQNVSVGGQMYPQQLKAPPQMMQQPPQGLEVKEEPDKGLISRIPTLHVQQQLVDQVASTEEPHTDPIDTAASDQDPGAKKENGDQVLQLLCLRCKKEFYQPVIIPKARGGGRNSKAVAEPKIFRLCEHCRDLQRQRLRRWQKKTRDNPGVCRRCASEIPRDEQRFVLCPTCRHNLRSRKANRAALGRCVHCSGPLSSSIITPGSSATSKPRFKVCDRCRENDKIRRSNLEKLGNCNRCAKPLEQEDVGKHKVCVNCRLRKRRLTQSSASPPASGMSDTMMAMPMGYGYQQQYPMVHVPQGQPPALLNEWRLSYQGRVLDFNMVRHAPQ